MSYTAVATAIKNQADPIRAKHSQRFFRTGKGEYGEGDIFLGLTVPVLRKIAKEYRDLPLPAIEQLLMSKYHEFRLGALFILVSQYQRGDDIKKNALLLSIENTFGQ